MGAHVDISIETLQAAAESQAVRSALAAQARLLLPRAQRVAAQNGRTRLAKALRIESGTRPGTNAHGGFKRPYVRLAATYTEDDRAADSRAKLSVRATLRRSVGG